MSDLNSMFVVTVGITILVTSIALLFAKKILTSLKVVDIPNHRSSHSQVTLRGAGIGPLVGIVFAVFLLAFIDLDEFGILLWVFMPASAVSIVGFVEDARGLPMKVRLLLQVFIGLVIGIIFQFDNIPLWLWIVLAGMGFAAYVNFANFMDGINGISGLHGVMVGSAFVVFGWVEDMIWLRAAGVILASAFVAFLPANLRKPGMFLGDVGSYLLGGAIAAISIAALTNGLHWFVIFAPLSIYLFDTIFTILNRMRLKESIFEAHRSHIYQKLTTSGFSHLAVSIVVSFFTLVASSIGLLYLVKALPLGVCLLLIILLCISYGLTPKVLRKKLNG